MDDLDFSVLFLIFNYMRKERKYHYIYKTTCNVTGRYYIGMHSTDNLDDGYIGSGKRLWFSINYHGKDNHSVEILEWYDTRKELREREKELVNEDLLKEGLCMNLKTGGDGGTQNEENQRKWILAGSKGFVDRFKSDEAFRTTVNKTRIAGIKQAHRDGKHKYDNFKDKSHSEETLTKMSKSSKGMGKGTTNSQYGTCWITKDGSNKKVKKEVVDEYFEIGWVKGRK